MQWAAGWRICCDATLPGKGAPDVSEERRGRRAPPPQEQPAGSDGIVAPGEPAPGPDAAVAGEVRPAGIAAAGPTEAGEDAAVLKDRWLRAEAELQNFRRRAAREREETRRSAEEGVMLELIAALDDLDRALSAVPGSDSPEPWTEGVRMVGSRLVEYLGRQGVVTLDPVGQPFDPVFHEAVLEMAVPDVAPGHVTQVLLRGWRRGGRALRAARVVVARAPDGEA
jgi:molecular chaperone GrpE